MKKYLEINGDEHALERAARFLREHGFDVAEIKSAESPRQSKQPSLAEYRDLIESAPIGVFRSTLDGKFISVNPATARILKYDSPEDLVETVNKSSIAEALYVEKGRRREVVKDLLLKEGWQLCEVQYRCKDGSIITCYYYIRMVKGPNGAITALEGFVEDITDRKRAEEAVLAAERQLRTLVENIPECIARFDRECRHLYVNPAVTRIFGLPKEFFIGKTLREINKPGDDPQNELLEKMIRRAFEEGAANVTEAHWDTGEGPRIFEVMHLPEIDGDGNVLSVLGVAHDITERKQAEAVLRKNLTLHQTIVRNAPVILYGFDRNGVFTLSEGKGLAGMGLKPGEIVGRSLFDVYRDHPEALGYLRRTLDGEAFTATLHFGDHVFDAYHEPVFGEDGGYAGTLGVVVDVTARTQAEEMINASLAEKEVLLKEVHHRVKNNMQIISTLLDLQSENIGDEEALNAFRDSQDRIKAMALVHEKLYESEDLASIDIAKYIEDLSAHLFGTYLVDSGRVALKVKCGDISIGVDQAIPCGLIINELVSNALKHAFPDRRPGEISISLDGEEDGRITLRLADNGVGMPPDFDWAQCESLGLQLVNMLVRQLFGTLAVDGTHGGTTFVISFPLNNPAGESGHGTGNGKS